MRLTSRRPLAWLVAVAGCVGSLPAAPPSLSSSPPVADNGQAATLAAASPEPSPAVKPLPTVASSPDPKVVASAQKLLEQGLVLYGRGEYEQAESALREAVLLYPFLPEANLVLGKVFLIRGSASRDRTMVNSARLMFEMAHALDPQLREAAVLLELFQAAPSE